MLLVVYAALALSQQEQATVNEKLNPLVTPPSHGGQVVSVISGSETGLQAIVTDARGPTTRDRLGSIDVALRGMGAAYSQGLSVRVNNAIELGGNDRSFHGEGMLDASGGYRWTVTNNQGPFIRGGVRAIIGGDALVYQSLLELPQAQFGYQYLASKKTLFEAGGRAGLSLFGRSDAPFERGVRSLDRVPDVGATATVKTGPINISADWSHFFPRDTGSQVDWMTAMVCGIAPHKIALCTELRAVFGDVHVGTEVLSSRVTQLGFTAGISGL